MTRKLLIIPIVHGEEEMGSLKEHIARISGEKMGETGHERQRAAVIEFWDRLDLFLQEILVHTDAREIQIFQDGLPTGGELGEKIVRECAENGIHNYRILVPLIESGAKLEQTESPQLLKEEYGLIREIFTAPSPQQRERLSSVHGKRLEELGRERDSFIALRIAEMLREDHMGILFIGATHNVTGLLPEGIHTYILDYDIEKIIQWLEE